MATNRDQSAVAAPRFGVAHLMLWVTCAAVYLALIRWMAAAQPGLLGLLIVCVQSLVVGAAWSGLAIFLRRSLGPRHSLKTARSPTEPGHWLAAILGAQWLISATLAAMDRAGPWRIFAAPDAVSQALTCCLLVLPTLDRKLAATWKVVFCLLVVLYSLPLLVACAQVWSIADAARLDQLSRVLRWVKPSLSLALVLAALVGDLRQKRRYSWLHWAGAALWLYAMAQALAFRLWAVLR